MSELYQRQRLWDDPRWRKCREKVKARDGYQCTYCGATDKLAVHHLDYSEPFNPAFCRTACQRCHGRISRTQQLRLDGRRPASDRAHVGENRFSDTVIRPGGPSDDA